MRRSLNGVVNLEIYQGSDYEQIIELDDSIVIYLDNTHFIGTLKSEFDDFVKVSYPISVVPNIDQDAGSNSDLDKVESVNIYIDNEVSSKLDKYRYMFDVFAFEDDIDKRTLLFQGIITVNKTLSRVVEEV